MWKKQPKKKFRTIFAMKIDLIKKWWKNVLILLQIKKAELEPKKKNILPELPEEKLDIGGFVESHRFLIGSILLVLILISGGYLLYRENYSKPRLTEKFENQDLKIKSLEAKIEELANRQSAQTNSSTEEVVTTQTTSQNSGQVAGAATSSIKPIGKVNINTASTSELDTLPGIGAAYAGRIIEYRNSHGGFKSTSELKSIKGIGDKTFEKLADLVTI